MNAVAFGKNIYCAPAVISSIAGISTDEAEKIIKQVTGQTKPVTGVYPSDMREALGRLGFRTRILSDQYRNSNLFCTLSILPDGLFILSVPGHCVLIEVEGKHRYICDNHTKKPINAAVSARGMQKVVSVIEVEQK